ncbi:MAG TPA: hypothetical protein IAC50_06915 [Candidatus Copromorpha excrementigallinarum]|uniref:Uncharacterized protein n=1 Tax=Candidatus Allocopromorpha excrementigallinarum TaxID=2840742 RepID=A0A9D1I1H5_9FIRM|nr:hypothetical protein [Candidatus Copromorpha excrementigallinarum]
MAHEILSVKLCELDKRISRLKGNIQLSEMEDPDSLEEEIRRLEKETFVSRTALQDNIKRSRSSTMKAVSSAYEEISKITGEVREKIYGTDRQNTMETSAEQQILLAEYILDFALQTVQEALLISMKAIWLQRKQEEKENG